MIAAIIGPVATLIDDVVKRAFPDATEQAKVQLALQTALLQADLSQLQAQLEVNKQEAASNSLFVAGWRPAVGWVCASAFGYTFVLQPFMAFTIGAVGGHLPPLPVLDTASIMQVLIGMLGLGAMRTYEKLNGKANGH
jgi:hypothetical protein